MIHATNPTQGVTPLERPLAIGEVKAATPSAFQEALQHALARVESSSTEAVRSIDRFLSGEATDVHTVALATQRAALQFEAFLQVRNKIVQAYQEVMRMQL